MTNPHRPGGRPPRALHETKLLTPKELANLLDIPVATLYSWRYQGKGPIGIRIGKHVRFDPADVRNWLEGQRQETRAGS